MRGDTRAVALLTVTALVVALGFGVVAPSHVMSNAYRRQALDPRPVLRAKRPSLGDELVRSGLLSPAWDSVLRETVPLTVRGTRFEGRWQVNRAPREEALNIYVLRADLGTAAADLPAGAEDALGNCAAAGAPNVVVCDGGFLRDFLENTGVSPLLRRMPSPAPRLASAQRGLLLWVIGHEVGHIVLGHAPSHFRAGAPTAVVPTSNLSQAHELQADSFLVTRLVQNDASGAEVVSLTIDLLNCEIERKIGTPPVGVGILYDYTDRRVVQYARGGTHPEFVVRGARLLDLAGQSASAQFAGLAAMAAPFIRHMREAPGERN